VIPRRLHQIWLGPRPVPLEWTESWRTLNPDFEYRMWREPDIEAFGLENVELYRRFRAEDIFDGAADVARSEILQRLGGVYVDADALAVRPLANAPFLEAAFFAVTEPGAPETALISNAFMGSTAGHPILARYIEAIGRVVDLRPMWQLTGPGALTHVIAGAERDGVDILPAWTFYATSLDGDEVSGGPAYGRHFWSTTAERWGQRGATPYPPH
jgi:mannosyltransferase OCH1-like enzyme